MKKKNFIQSNIIFIGGILAFIAAASPFFIYPSDNESINWQRSQVTLTAIAFPSILYAFYSTTIQLQKSMAKPKLELIFTDTNNSEKSINIRPIEEDKHYLKISVINRGNAITDMFQIDYDIPEIFNPDGISTTFNSVHHRKDKDNRIVSFVNKHEYVCFVNLPTTIPSLVLHTYEKQYAKYTSELVISYKIFGDWAETQEGTLKVIINKQEVPHVPTSG